MLQPLDNHLNKPFKDAMRIKWEEWLLNGDREYTRTGKCKGASYEMVAQWVSEVWREMSRDIIKRSFIETGIQDCDDDEVLHSKLQSILAGTDPSEVDDDVEDSEASDLESYADESDSDNEESGEKVVTMIVTLTVKSLTNMLSKVLFASTFSNFSVRLFILFV